MIDVVIISEAMTHQLEMMTQKAVDSAHQCSTIPIRVIVVERTDAIYDEAIVVHDKKPFNYNRLVNNAIRCATSNEIIVANNDVEFMNGSIPILAQSRPLVVSPIDPDGSIEVDGIEFGTQVARHFMGWCFLIRRNLWVHLGGFCEDYPFWYADNVIVDQLRTIGVTPAVCGDAHVRHKVSATLYHHSAEVQYELTHAASRKYNSLRNQI